MKKILTYLNTLTEKVIKIFCFKILSVLLNNLIQNDYLNLNGKFLLMFNLNFN